MFKYLRMTHILFLSLFLSSHTAHAVKSDIAKEQRWADQVTDSLMDGDAVMLKAGEHSFLGLYTEAEDTSSRAVIIAHGTGAHPDWPQVVYPLRSQLTEQGWHTLSIQMPVLDNDADYKEYAPLYDEIAPRMNAAVEYLLKQGVKTIVSVGHSQGSAMSAYYLSSQPEKIRGFVAIGMPVFDHDPRMNSLISLSKIQLPVLDLYGTEDHEGIRNSADKRAKAAAKAGNKQYQQKIITGDHFFDGHEDGLIQAVSEWLKRY